MVRPGWPQVAQGGCARPREALPGPTDARPPAGNMLGDEGCEQLQEALQSFDMAGVLASLR